MLASARARVEAARAGRAAAEQQVWPNPTLGVSYENEANPGGASERILRGTLSIPLPFWVSNTGALAEADAEVERTSAEREALESVVGHRVLQARERVRASAERARVFGTEIVPTFETNLELLDKAFELGEIDVLQVMVAQERFLRTQTDALQSFADYYSAWAELEAAVGAELLPSGPSAEEAH
jgi:cobalt-zinc-cadmium efflux system outer membrane protein